MLENIIISTLVFTPIIVAGCTMYSEDILSYFKGKKEKKKLKLEAVKQFGKEMTEEELRKQRFPMKEQPEGQNISVIVRMLLESEIPHEPWMDKIIIYEGNMIHSDKIKHLFWSELEDVNARIKHLEFLLEIDEITIGELQSMLELFKNKCKICYDLMVENAKLSDEVSILEPNIDVGNVSVEVQKLYAILLSDESTEEMKHEARELIKSWEQLAPAPLNKNVEDMNLDLLTIKNIIASKRKEV